MLRALPGLRISGSCVVPYSIDLLPLTAPGLFLYDCHSVFYRKKFRLRLPSRTLVLGERTLIMGVLNVTPDSFSDGGAFLDSQTAVARALELERDGADIIDIGGESTRPAAAPVSAREEISRILPIFEALRGKLRIPISVDTQKAEVAEAALAAGAASATSAFCVSTEIGIRSLPRRASNTGRMREISSRAETGAAAGRVDSPPMSMISAPSRSNSNARATAVCESRKAPPSEKLSGVTFSTPMIKVRSPSTNVREGKRRRNFLR